MASVFLLTWIIPAIIGVKILWMGTSPEAGTSLTDFFSDRMKSHESYSSAYNKEGKDLGNIV